MIYKYDIPMGCTTGTNALREGYKIHEREKIDKHPRFSICTHFVQSANSAGVRGYSAQRDPFNKMNHATAWFIQLNESRC